MEVYREIRKQYGLSQNLFAKVLGIGEVTVGRYENGLAVPSPMFATIYNILRDNPYLIIYFYKQNKTTLTEKQIYKVETKLIKNGYWRNIIHER